MSKTIKILVLVAVVIGAFGTGYYFGAGGVSTYATTKPITVSIEITLKNGEQIAKNLTLRDGMTVFDALLKTTNIQTKYWESFESSTVIAIADSVTDPSTEGYVYEVNGEVPSVAMNDYQLHDGDQIKIYYTKW